MLVLRNDPQTQDPSVPLRRLMAVGHEQFDVIYLIDSESIALL
jgi:hypothetical protein